jgi:ParB family transcriptional regulator, chromosome partitioning protein
MAKKRGIFDINFDPDFELETETPVSETPQVEARRGPMASAITEAAEATQARAAAEAAIRQENDALAHEYVRLKKLGLITDLIEVSDVRTEKLTRDRAEGRDPEMEELKQSIQTVGLSNPIRVEKVEDGYELIQGFRRLTAFRELLEETGDRRYSRIPAALVPRGEPMLDLYRKMVDENLVRRDISFGEMAQLALSYARDTGVKPDEAVSQLYASALKQKRTYIRSFARVLERADGAIKFPEAIPRALGLDIAKVLDHDAQLGDRMIEMLGAEPDRDASREPAILRAFVVAAPKAPQSRPITTKGKTTLQMNRREGPAKVTATDGKLELRLDRDFSNVSRTRLQSAMEAFFAVLDKR